MPLVHILRYSPVPLLSSPPCNQVAGSDVSDAIDLPLPQKFTNYTMTQKAFPVAVIPVRSEVGAPLEDLMLLVFDTLDYKTLNHPIFIDQLLCAFRSLGLAEKHASSLQIKLSPGSVVAEIFGPPALRKPLEALPFQYVEVMGCYARKMEKAPPRFKQTRPMSSLSDATVLSSGSSKLMESQANELLNLWIETPKSEAVTTQSGMEGAANQLVNQLVEADSSHPEHQELQGFIQESIKPEAASETDVIRDEGGNQTFVAETAHEITQEAVQNQEPASKPSDSIGDNEAPRSIQTPNSVAATSQSFLGDSYATEACDSVAAGIVQRTMDYALAQGVSQEQVSEVPAVQPAEKPSEPPAVRPVEKPAEVPVVQPAEKPSEAAAVQPVEKPAEVPAVQPVEKPAEVPVVQPAEKPSEAAAVQPVEKPAEVPVVQPAEKPSEAAAVQPVEKPAEVPAVQPVEKPAEVSPESLSGPSNSVACDSYGHSDAAKQLLNQFVVSSSTVDLFKVCRALDLHCFACLFRSFSWLPFSETIPSLRHLDQKNRLNKRS